ncbi:MAG TPA: ABC transporter substrate-binding protein, partial [Gemmataceae bacterium]|nr:ABC transporter substrate-binding protein [Gemmataceae bacterium]
LPGLHDFRLKLDNALSILRVGVRDLPVNLSPGTAVTDSEKQAVELLFESLIKLSYDPDLGQHYVAGLAEGRPRLISQGRQFQLDHDAYWSNEKPITVADVRNTVALLKNRKWDGHNPAWADLIENVPVGADPYRINVTLRQGFFDPLSLMTFKVLPLEPWPSHALTTADEVRFAQHPVGSGPYQLQGPGQTKSGRPYVAFTANPSYGSRARKADLPRIHEIQFFQAADPIKDLQTGDLDLIVDLPTDKVKAAQGLGNVKVLPPLPNRRIWFLAVNNRQRELQNQELRKALAHAIDREKILNEVFRADLGPAVHKALNGPYPAGSWACDAGLRYNHDVARRGIKKAEEAGIKSGIHLTLKYPNDDPRVEQATKSIKEQVAKEIGVTLDLQALPPRELHDSVEGSHNYQLAYYHYDFPSEAYWLWPLFDPRAVDDGGTNYLGYHNDSRLESLFQQVMGHCDFEQVRKSTQALHQLLFEKMPLIPLWQLDTHIAKAKDLKFDPVAPDVVRFDPVLVFTDVDQWRIEKK